MLINGRVLAKEIQEQLRVEFGEIEREVIFSIIYVGEDSVIDNFIRYKERFGLAVGVDVQIHRFDESITTEDLYDEIVMIGSESDAIIVQLPLPDHIDQDMVLSAVPVSKDVDVLSSYSVDAFAEASNNMLPPVTGAMLHVIDSVNVEFANKQISIVGDGALVGRPFSLWLDQKGYPYEIFTHESNQEEMKKSLLSSDIVITGAGSPGLIKPDMIKDGVVLLDGGTSESGKKVVGDIDPDCVQKARFMTPVPGGIGPLTIAVLYQNILKAVQS